MSAAKARIFALLLCWAGAAICAFGTGAALADVPVPPLTGRVVDQTGTLSSADIAALTQKLKDLEARKGSQVAVLIVPTTAPETIEQYSIRVTDAWKIGRKKIDDGALLLVAKDDHRLRIEVGYGLEGVLTDITSQRIIDEVITPKFRSGDFAGGIAAGVDRIIAAIDGETLPAPTPRQSTKPLGSIEDLFNPFVIVGVIVVGALLRATLGRLIGSVATGGVVGALAWFLVGSLTLSLLSAVIAFVFTLVGESIASANGRGGYIGGDSFSGRSGSSDSGGFSGGGGNFGGGGASGSW